MGHSALVVAGLVLRTVGGTAPLLLLGFFLWPVAMLRSCWELGPGRTRLADFRKLAGPPLLPPGESLTLRRLLLGRTRLNLAKLLFLWPEKLATSRGISCRVVGGDRLAAIEAAGGPAVLLTLHFGPMSLLLNWLRARGYPAAMVAVKGRRQDLSWFRRYLARRRDAPVGLETLPSLIEVGQVWEMRGHLDARGLLLVAVDGGHGRHAASPVADGLALAMNTGALKLAAMTGAPVIPCLIRSGPRFSLILHLGEPLPAAEVADKARYGDACDRLYRAFLPVLAAAPEECSYELLAALRRQAADGEVGRA